MDPTLGETPREHAHHVADSVIAVEYLAELDALRAGDTYQQTDDHAAKTIAKQPEMRVVLIALKPGGHLHEHHTDAPIVLQGLAGNVEVTVAGEAFRLRPGSLLAVAAAIPHSVTTSEESAVLLTIGGDTGHDGVEYSRSPL